MRRFSTIILTGLAIALLQGCVINNGPDGGGSGWAYCGRDVRLRIVDLDMTPDPVADGQRINRFRVNLRSEGRANCEVRLQIRETQGNDLIADERLYRFRPGANRIDIEPEGRYRFSRNEHCFNVLVNIDNTWLPVDTARRFCARRAGDRRWSLQS
jgi:hypothetical protein